MRLSEGRVAERSLRERFPQEEDKEEHQRTGRVTCAYVTSKLHRLGPEPGSLVEADIASPMVHI